METMFGWEAALSVVFLGLVFWIVRKIRGPLPPRPTEEKEEVKPTEE